MSPKIENAESRATFFGHSTVLSLPAVLLRKLPNIAGQLKLGLNRPLGDYDTKYKFSPMYCDCKYELLLIIRINNNK